MNGSAGFQDLDSTKGQEISEWIYEVVALPQNINENIRKILPWSLEQNFRVVILE